MSLSRDRVARRILAAERQSFHANTAPRLPYSSIDDGAIELRDIEGNVAGYVGQQFDGTITSAAVGGTWPSRPAGILVEPTIGGLKMYWDGTYDDGSYTRMDFKRVTFHAVTDLADLDILSPAQMVGEITTAAGGEAACWLPPIEHYVVAVAWTDAGKFSEPSDPDFATPIRGTSYDEWQEHEQALATRIKIRNDATQPTGLGPDDRVLWYDSSDGNALSYWDGTAWGPYQLGAGAIAPSSIDTIHLNAGSVTSDIIDTEVLRAGMTLTGRLQVGESYWTPAEGLVIPQPDGDATRFPSNGLTAARIAGHVKAKSLTVEKDFNLLGTTNQVAGNLKLANGITAPVNKPSLYPSWNTRTSSTINNVAGGYSNQIFRGMASAPNVNHFLVAINYIGTTLRLVHKDTGAWAGDAANPNTKTWAASFYPQGGVGFANSHYFIYGQDGTRNNDWYLYKINANYDKVAELRVGAYTIHNSNSLRVTASSATGGVYVVFCNDANQVRMLTWDTNLGFLSDSLLYTATAPRNIDATYVGPADYGSNKVLVGVREEGTVMAWGLSNLVRDTTIEFPMGNGAKIQGLHYDSTLGKLLSYDQEGRIVHYSSARNPRAITATYTWYDGDGTVRETTPSPIETSTFIARALVNVETDVPPDSGVTDPSRVDKANRVGIYLGEAGATRRRQIYLGVDGSGVSIRKHTTDLVTSNLNVEPTTNGFITANVAPGSLTSAAVNGTGVPLLEFTGAGDGRVRNLEITGNLTRPARSSTAYTPVLTPGSGTLFSASATGNYIVFDGRVCQVRFQIQITDAGTAANSTLAVSLPFTTAGTTVELVRENQATGSTLQAVVGGGTANILTLTNGGFLASGRTYIFKATYEIA